MQKLIYHLLSQRPHVYSRRKSILRSGLLGSIEGHPCHLLRVVCVLHSNARNGIVVLHIAHTRLHKHRLERAAHEIVVPDHVSLVLLALLVFIVFVVQPS